MLYHIILMVILFIGTCIIFRYFVKKRAFNNKPYGFKTGMVFNKNTKRLQEIKTPIYEDHLTGEIFLGRTEIIK